ncbi:fatty acid amide hydrolase isoform X2 [Cajanus cajan]|uniref:Glutamyl-tRNA(Gln) amidotransferase subunit A n=1 Tax=Cajanus cajan TaxID=3821 RepID=A0A151R6Z3_CAJCA|nr:fatty acid amide hydrolase isoform X2 [Cajanus cajan]KYP38398.1 Glutamyl-tRNA(Gln) amidotransferase subunit A [Cajanus cajan]
MGLFKSKGVVYRPVKDVNLGADSTEFYLQANVKAPRMTGILVKIFTWFLESPVFGALLLYILKGNNLIHKLITNAELEESPLFVPSHNFEDHKEQEVKCLDSALTPQEQVQLAIECLPTSSEKAHNETVPSFCRWTVMDYSRAYNSGDITPLMVAERFIAAVQESSKPALQMGFFINYNADDILKQANESTLRYQKGSPISVLDGVPVAIKDEIDCSPYPTTGGTKWLHKERPCIDDAYCVKRLRLCGAILVGKTNMHELGAGTSGINPHYGPARNPYDTNKIAGGSSSGSAAVVSAGLCPVALGVDGGGSVRMPASLCGVVGLKPTFGRVPHAGVLPMNWTVGMIGILAGTVEDALITYAAISGEIPSHQPSSIVTKINLPLLRLTKSICDIKLAKYGKWFDDCSDDVRLCCSLALSMLQDHYGWKTIDVTIPDIEAMRLAHYITIGSECSTWVDSFGDKHFAESGWDARVALNIYGAFSSKEYIKAQKMRNRQLQFHKKIFAEADVIVSPTTGVTAYSIQDDALKTGELDYVNGAALVRYSISGNFLGLPAVTVAVGYDKLGLPIGLQFIGRPWAEATLIHLAFAMQAICLSEYRKPKIYYDLLRKD